MITLYFGAQHIAQAYKFRETGILISNTKLEAYKFPKRI